MEGKMKNIVEVNYLIENRDRVILVDATNNFMIPEEGRQKHDKAHIAGAFHIDLRKDMVGTIGEHGGRDPLPDNLETFAKKLEEFGISNDSEIVVYDEDLVPSSRFWWMCKYIGVNNVKVLNGGVNAWTRAGQMLTDEPTVFPEKKGKVITQINHKMYADIKDIRRAIEDPSVAIIDSRTAERYKGIVEPIDKKAGHIPGSLNYFYGEVIDPVKGYKDAEFFKKHYKSLFEFDELIVHCGSGVSGSVNLIAMDEIGLEAKFYIGSWSDYITYPENLIVTEE